MAEELRRRSEDILLRANQHQPAAAAPEEERTAHTAAVRKMRQAVILAGDLVQRLCMAAAEGTRRQGRPGGYTCKTPGGDSDGTEAATEVRALAGVHVERPN